MIRIPDPIGFNGNMDVNPLTGDFLTDAQKCMVSSEVLNLAHGVDQRFVTSGGLYGIVISAEDDRCAIVIPELDFIVSTHN